MEPHNLSFGGGAAESVFNPIALAIVVIAGVLICILPRNKIVIAFLPAGLLLPINQVLVVAGLHFPMMRVLALFGFARMGWEKITGKANVFSGGINKIDWALIILTVFMAIDGALLWRSGGEVIFQLGNVFTVFGLYFLLRYSIQDEEDVKRTLKTMAFVVAIIAPAMVYEHFTSNNPFYMLLGGLHAARLQHAASRDGFFRAQGPFGHAIIAGTFGGFMVPLFVALWTRGKRERKYAVLGLISCTIIPLAVASSTALFTLLGGIGALCLWPFRRMMRLLRWGIVATLIAGEIYMTKPVWHLIDDVSLSQGSSSYHRYQLVNQCILHFWDWALIGTKNYASWGWDMWDLANEYVKTADTAGLIPFIAFLAVLVYAYKYIGRARRHYDGSNQELFIWAIGAAVFANTVGFFGISYWDQVIVAWYMVLAIVAAVTLPARQPKAEAAMEAAEAPLTPTCGLPAAAAPIYVPLNAGMKRSKRFAAEVRKGMQHGRSGAGPR